MKRRIFFLVLCFAVLLSGVYAQDQQYVLSGKVTDKEGKPLPAVAVAIENSSVGTYTDDNGAYRLAVTAGQKSLVVSCIGYQPVRKTVVVGRDRIFDFVLAESSVALHSVEVYGKTKTQKVREGAFSVNAIDIKPIVGTLNNLNTMVDRTTGIKVREEGGVGSDFDLSINGMSGNSVRYFIDGIPLSAKGSGVNLANLPVNIIDRIEIYKGVVPAALGADALGGAINIITKEEKNNYLDVSYGIGSFHTHKVNLYGQYVDRKTGIALHPTVAVNFSKNDYKMWDVEEWNEAAGKYVPVDKKRFHDDYLSLLFQIEGGVVNKKWADAFFVSASYTATDKELQTGSIQKIVYGEARREQDALNVSVRYRKKDFLFPKLHLNASVSHTWDHSLTVDTAFRKYNWNGDFISSSRNEITGRGKSLRHYKRPLTIARGNFDYRLNDGHSLNLNYLLSRTGNHRYDDVDREFEPSDDRLTKHITGLSLNQSLWEERMHNIFFIKDYVNVLKIGQQDLYWITGADKVPSSSAKNHLGYGVGTRYLLKEALALKASFEHSIRLPLARELLGNGTTVYPNLRLDPENSNNGNIGAYGTLYPAPGHLFYYEANGFYRDVNDYIHAVVSEAEGMMQYENVASVDIKGIEGEIRYNWKERLQLTANCSYQDARDRQKYKADGKPSISYRNKLPNRPWLFANADVELMFRDLFEKADKLRVGYHYQYVHWFFLTWEGYGVLDSKSKIPTQHVHSAHLSYSWHKERYNVSLECTNLMDAKLFDNYMLQKPGRSFFCKFRIFIH